MVYEVQYLKMSYHEKPQTVFSKPLQRFYTLNDQVLTQEDKTK